VRLPPFEFHAPTALEQVFELLATYGAAARLMSGGTDLLPGLRTGKVRCEHVIALKRVAGLGGLEFDPARGLAIGAGAILADVGRHPATRTHYPALASAIDTLATVQVRNKGTVAGNLCNASPCADTATPLMALGARVVLAGPDGRREVGVEEFLVGPDHTRLAQVELVERILVPPPRAGLRTIFQKISPRSRVDIAAVNMTLALTTKGGAFEHVALFLGTVAPTPMRAARAEKALEGREINAENIEAAALAARAECRPITDLRATKEYKAHIVYVLTRRALQTLTAEA